MRTSAVISSLAMLCASACISPTDCGCKPHPTAVAVVFGTVKRTSGTGIPSALLTLSARSGSCAEPAADVTVFSQGSTATDSTGAFRINIVASLGAPICVRVAAEGVPAPGLVRSASGAAAFPMRAYGPDSARIDLTLVE